jgi:hypothetical protein
LITLPFPTAEGRQSHALRIGGSCATNTVLLISGAHAREWGGPDILINLAADILEAGNLNTGLSYGGTIVHCSRDPDSPQEDRADCVSGHQS